MPKSPQSLLRLCTGLGATLLGSTWLTCLPARADLVPTTGLRSLGTSLRMNGLAAPGCSAGLCQVEGGTSRGANLFHRFAQFDTRNGITQVDFLNGLQRAVIVGVTSPTGSFINVPVTGQNGAGLFFLSPGGINISGGGGFTGWGNLLLTTKANLAIGANQFNAFNTVPDTSAGWSTDPVLEHASLSTDLQSLTDNGLSGDGPITVTGSMISINSNLLIDSGSNTLTLANNARLEAGTTGTVFGETTNGGLSLKGKTISSTDATITALRSQLLGDSVTLTRTTILSPRGQIRIAAADGISLVNSKLDISPQKIEDLYSDGLGFRSGPVISTVPGVINLATTNPSGAGIVLNNSSLDASIDLNVNDGQGNPRFDPLLINDAFLHPALVAGNMLISSAGLLDVDQTAITANASRGFAGHISLVSQNPSSSLSIRNNSLITANAPQGSGDLDVYAKGGVSIAGSRLEANSTGYPSDFLNNFALQPAGNIFITSDGGTAGINLTDSTVQSRYELIDQALATAYVDALDPADNQQTFLPSSLIQLRSATGITLERSNLDGSSASGYGATIELLARGGNGVAIGGSTISAAIVAPNGQAPAAVAADLLNGFGCSDCFLSLPGTISIYSQAGISIGKDATETTDSSLDLSSTFPFNFSNLLFTGQEVGRLNLINTSTTRPLELGPGTQINAQSAPGGLASSQLLIGSQGGVSLEGTTINTTGGPGGEITITNRGPAPIAISGSQISNLGEDADGVPPIRLIGLEGSPINLGAGNLFDTDPAQIVSALTADDVLGNPNPDDYTAYLAANDAFTARADALSTSAQTGPQTFTANGSVPRQQFLSQSLDLSNPAEEVDIFIDNRDPNKVIITTFTRSADVFQPVVSQESVTFDLGNAEEASRLRALLGDTVYASVVSTTTTPLAPLTLANAPDGATQTVAGSSAKPEIAKSGISESEAAPGAAGTTPTGTPSLAVKSAENLDPKKALESLDEGELTSLQAVSQALGLGGTLASPPSIFQLQGYMRAAIEAIRLRQKALAWNQGDSQTQAIATASTDNLLLAKASFDQASYKPAILRYSFTPKPADDAKGPPMGLIDIVLVLPDGEPQGWRMEVPIARLREALARHYANMASMGPLPGGNPAASPAANQLAQLLLEPVQATLKANGVTSLIISSDLNLIDVPYASLPLGGGYLGERYAVTITPSLALTSLTSNEKPPIYGKDSLIRAGATQFANGLAPLPMVEQEVTTIAREDGGTVLLNQAFNSSSLLKALADPAVKRIHIASHAELKPGKEADARIHTSSSSVGLKEMGQLRQRSAGQGLDLVSLSACRSAVSGSELELGFAGMAIQLGAKSAIGTKWYVDDLATSSFFVQFYRYLEQGIPKAEAIQMTQKAFLSGEVHLQGDKVVGSGGNTLMAGLTPAQQRRYAGGFSHPYFWASVQLVGSPW